MKIAIISSLILSLCICAAAADMMDIQVTEENMQKILRIKKEELEIAQKNDSIIDQPGGTEVHMKEVFEAIKRHGLTQEEYAAISMKVLTVMTQRFHAGAQAGTGGDTFQVSQRETEIIKKYLPEWNSLIEAGLPDNPYQ